MQSVRSRKELEFKVNSLKKDFDKLIEKYPGLVDIYWHLCNDVPTEDLILMADVAIMKAETGGVDDPDRDCVSRIAMQLEIKEEQEIRVREIADLKYSKKLQVEELKGREAENRKHAKKLQIVKIQDEIAEIQKTRERAFELNECKNRRYALEFQAEEDRKYAERLEKQRAEELADKKFAEQLTSIELAKQLKPDNFASGAASAADAGYNVDVAYRNIQTSTDGTRFSVISKQTYVFCKCGKDFCIGEEIHCGIVRCFVVPGVHPDISHPANRMQHGSNESAILAMEKMRKAGIIVFGCGQQYDCRNPLNPIRSDNL